MRASRDTDEMEWRAWHRIVLALDELGIDMNANAAKPLGDAIKVWGEWRTMQHLQQDHVYFETPLDFDPDEVGVAMANRTIRATRTNDAARELPSG